MTYAMQIYIKQAKFLFPKSTKKHKIQKLFTPFNAPVSNNYFAKLFFQKIFKILVIKRTIYSIYI